MAGWLGGAWTLFGRKWVAGGLRCDSGGHLRWGQRRAWWLLGVGLCVSGCLSELEPDVGPLLDSGPLRDSGPECELVDSDPDTDVSFGTEVWPMLSAGCGCHSPGPTSGLSFANYASLRLGGDQSGPDVIVDSDPCASLLLGKVSEEPPFGARMPYDGPYLSLSQQQLLQDWIVEGARDN